MRYVGYLSLLLSLACAASVDAHEIGIGDIFYSLTTFGQKIETEHLIITTENPDEPIYEDLHYRLTVRSKKTGAESATDFHQDGGLYFRLIAFNRRYYCGEEVIFISLRYDTPRNADIRSYLIDTHAFHRESLGYLATAYGHYEDITPLEKGVDIGFPYEMPQRFVVECSGSTASHDFKFSITDRAQK